MGFASHERWHRLQCFGWHRLPPPCHLGASLATGGVGEGTGRVVRVTSYLSACVGLVPRCPTMAPEGVEGVRRAPSGRDGILGASALGECWPTGCQ